MKDTYQIVVALIEEGAHDVWQNCQDPAVPVAEVCRRVSGDPSQAERYLSQPVGGQRITFADLQRELHGPVWVCDAEEGEIFSLLLVAATARGRPDVGHLFHLAGSQETYDAIEPVLVGVNE